ncbi:GDP-mannose 4,6-dehydratase [Mesorhizobium sp.]|uniref:GDP-mannose 4,6-dehydratase n=1 Tax=Mesorhizobium sp. TaxID=1871066 RepID=UPI003418A6B3
MPSSLARGAAKDGHTAMSGACMWPILQHHEPDDFVLATGETHSVRSFVEVAVRRFGKEIFREG